MRITNSGENKMRAVIISKVPPRLLTLFHRLRIFNYFIEIIDQLMSSFKFKEKLYLLSKLFNYSII
jgi:recombinational DNA repair protein (RecF pathway)